jgi:flavin-dependent dehydrogenase
VAGFRCTIARRGGARETLTSDWLVDATGRRTAATIALGGARGVCDRLTGLCRRLSPTEVDADAWRNVGLIEGVDDGYWYTAPLPDGRIVAVFLSDADSHDARSHAEARWSAALRKSSHTASRVEGCRPATKVFRCDARSQYAVAPSCPRLLLVGDASVAFDPLSADGVARAIDSARGAAESILADRDSSASQAALRYHQFASYERERGANYGIERRYDHRFWRRRRASERALLGVDPRQPFEAGGDPAHEATARAEATLGMDNVEALLSIVRAQPGIEAGFALQQVRSASHREIPAEQWIMGLEALLEDAALRAASEVETT